MLQQQQFSERSSIQKSRRKRLTLQAKRTASHKHKRYQIINHGPDRPDYFPGYGLMHTPFTHVEVGIGVNAKEAYLDALFNMESDLNLPINPRGIRQSDKLNKEELDAEFMWYVVVYVNCH